jgi:hypothetical protein
MPFHQKEQVSKTMLWWRMTQVLTRFSLKPSVRNILSREIRIRLFKQGKNGIVLKKHIS